MNHRVLCVSHARWISGMYHRLRRDEIESVWNCVIVDKMESQTDCEPQKTERGRDDSPRFDRKDEETS